MVEMLSPVDEAEIGTCCHSKVVPQNNTEWFQDYHLVARPPARELCLVVAAFPAQFNGNPEATVAGGMGYLSGLAGLDAGHLAEMLRSFKPHLTPESRCAVLISGGENDGNGSLAQRQGLGTLALAGFETIGMPRHQVEVLTLEPDRRLLGVDLDCTVGAVNYAILA